MHILKRVMLGCALLLPNTATIFAEASASVSIAANQKEDRKKTIAMLIAKAIEVKTEIHNKQVADLYAKAWAHKLSGGVCMVLSGGFGIALAATGHFVLPADIAFLVLLGACGLGSFIYGAYLSSNAESLEKAFSISEFERTLHVKMDQSSDAIVALINVVEELRSTQNKYEIAKAHERMNGLQTQIILNSLTR